MAPEVNATLLAGGESFPYNRGAFQSEPGKLFDSTYFRLDLSCENCDGNLLTRVIFKYFNPNLCLESRLNPTLIYKFNSVYSNIINTIQYMLVRIVYTYRTFKATLLLNFVFNWIWKLFSPRIVSFQMCVTWFVTIKNLCDKNAQ